MGLLGDIKNRLLINAFFRPFFGFVACKKLKIRDLKSQVEKKNINIKNVVFYCIFG